MATTVTTTTPSSSATDPGMLGEWYSQYKGPGPAATYTPTTATTTDWTVDKNQTVQGQVADITNADGVLMQQAATKGLQQSNQRGLLNTSLGVQASQNALYEAAMPMATQDASTYADAAKTNAGERNTTSRFNAGEKNNAGQFNAGAANDLNLGMFNNATSIYRDRANNEFTAGENATDRAFRTTERVAGQEFTAGENVKNRDFENANREDTQKFNSAENTAQRSWQTGERTAGQVFTAGETALNRAWQSGERVSAQTYEAAQATLDRDQQSKIQALQEQGMTARQATDIASRERMQIAQQTFDSATLAKEQAFILEKDAKDFEQDLAVLDQQNGTALAGQYRNAMGQALNDYNARVAEIQASDMDADVKAEQVASLGTLFLQQQQFTNTLFESAPAWGDEWATVSSEFLDEEG